jgi:uracil phosphoribosyltransferase
MIRILGERNSLFNQYIFELRDKEIQKDAMRFRKNLERLGEIFAYEISKELDYEEKSVQTPLGIADMKILKQNIVIASVLRAGLPMHTGLLNYFDRSENAFVTAYRKYHKDNSFDIKIGYLSSPSLENRYLILSDPMLATGSSLELAYRNILEKGTPIHTHFVTAIAAKEGVEYLQKKMGDTSYTLWIGVIDDELTAKSYIVPGLGDAGDLAFGTKI